MNFDIDLKEYLGSLASISNENAGQGAVDEADNEIVDPNNVNETTDIHQTKKQAEKKR